MAVDKVYTCNLCGMVVEDLKKVFGVNWGRDGKTITLGGYGSTDRTHLCFDCARQLREQLNNEQIQRFLRHQEDVKRMITEATTVQRVTGASDQVYP